MQRLLLFNWLRNRRYEKERGSMGNWEDSWNFIGAFFGGTGWCLSLITKQQQAWVNVWIKVVLWGCSRLYTPKTRWFVIYNLSAHGRSDPPIMRHLLCACVFSNNIRRMFWCWLSGLIPAYTGLKTAKVEF